MKPLAIIALSGLLGVWAPPNAFAWGAFHGGYGGGAYRGAWGGATGSARSLRPGSLLPSPVTGRTASAATGVLPPPRR